jgi:hypothetical protein
MQTLYKNERSTFDKIIIENEKKEFNNKGWSDPHPPMKTPFEYISTPTNGMSCCYSTLEKYDSYGYRPILAPVPVTSLPLFKRY